MPHVKTKTAPTDVSVKVVLLEMDNLAMVTEQIRKEQNETGQKNRT
jgi:hypothetical protein